ncbi:MAG: hypothetical protein A3C71_00505 [Candidatus Yanofskybacteria bacterium RIFCSPHIGHO2_02_FULL_43_15c]|uniref:Uncharacterized protein n=1 Tax=Candidatus Yanofskybacteria bacterium RIFCSPHIGHO2_02_FULL_43_15c TaxID=1802679 RepID=A0A1F8FMF9_9BACT|nr:MAG: hypothetical protein A3C71_00505 [Candidatus Yanofskybacteria bacterium RIFCSPHIGHO2_02_FULL_43_15c]
MKRLNFLWPMFSFFVFNGWLYAQSGSSGQSQGALSEARLHGDFSKRFERDIFQPFFSWEGRIGFETVVFRRGRQTVFFKSEILTVGGAIIRDRVNVIGTSYLLESRYQFSVLNSFHLGGGWSHNSSHLTQDLTELVGREIGMGKPVPSIEAGDLNVIFGEIKWEPSMPLNPLMVVRIQPVNLRGFRGGPSFYDRPIYLAIEEELWKGREKRMVSAVQHEMGRQGFSDFSIRLELFAKNQKEGRLQLLIGGSPGSELHASTNYPWYKNGLRAGLRIVFNTK